MSHWDYRVMQFSDGGLLWRAIHEVYYDDDDKPISYTDEPAVVMWDANDQSVLPVGVSSGLAQKLRRKLLVHEHAPDFGLMTLQPGFLCRKSLNSSAAFFSQARTLCE